MRNGSFFKYILFICILFVAACEDIIDVDLNSAEPRVVIEGIVAEDSFAVVKITMTKDFGSTNEYIPVRDAVVKISDDMGNSETLEVNSGGYYVSSEITGVAGRTYNLLVAHEGKEYTSVSKMPPLVLIDSLTLFDFPFLDYPTPMVHFTDPKGADNDYYRFIVYVNGERPMNEYSLISAKYMDGFSVHQRLSVPHNHNDEDDPVKQGDILTVEMQCIDEDCYTFWDTLLMIENSLTNPTNNISGGALGYFSAYTFSKKSIEAVW